VQDKSTLEDTLALMRDLRRRCEWDRAQTHESLRPYLIEEAYEVDDAIQQASAGGDPGALRDELGDLLLQVVFHAVVAEERGAFDLHDVAHALVTKMRARHPHLYPAEGAPAARPSGRTGRGRRRGPRSRSTRGSGRAPALHRRTGCRTAPPAWASTGPTRGPAGEGAPRSWPRCARSSRRAGPPSRDTVAPPTTRTTPRRGELGRPAVRLREPLPQGGVHASLALDRANAKFAARSARSSASPRARDRRRDRPGSKLLDELWTR
jgi:NTP pyrophosphatase (non-canonical NTP hydrolase)